MKNARQVLVAGAVALLALSGCAHGAADAAIVNGVTLPDSEIVAASNAAAPILQQEAGSLATSVVQAEVQGLIAEQIGAAHNVQLTDATRASVIAASAQLAALAKSADGKTLATRLADTNLVASKVDTSTFATECAATSVSLNPRYGTWSKELCGMDSAMGSLSKPAPTAAASNG